MKNINGGDDLEKIFGGDDLEKMFTLLANFDAEKPYNNVLWVSKECYEAITELLESEKGEKQ